MSKKGKASPNRGKKGKPWSQQRRDAMHDLLVGSVTINNGVIESHVKPDDVDDYISSGWCRGRLRKDINTISKGHKIQCVETGEIFPSIRECSNKMCIDRYILSQHLKGNK